MRRTYQASLAAIAVTGYVSGSGDRHMDNYLLSSATGALVPIDFGCVALLVAAWAGLCSISTMSHKPPALQAESACPTHLTAGHGNHASTLTGASQRAGYRA